MADSALTRPMAVFWRLALSSALRRPSDTAIGASEVVSTPPAMPASIWPSLILLEMEDSASMPVAHACWMSYAGVVGSRAEPSTHSRTRLKSRECLSTAPAATEPRRSPARP